MIDIIRFGVVGVVVGSIYAIAASGLVVTYTTTGIFNFAHGAVGMIAAFVYWELSVNRGWAELPALLVVLFLLAPLMGVLMERVLFRRLADATTGVTLVVTVGLLVVLLGLGNTLWLPRARLVPGFFEGRTVDIFDITLRYHQLVVLASAAVVAFTLRILLFQTRIGVAMRAVVDNRELAAQNGALPERVAQTSWALGSVLAALAGILLAPELALNQLALTLLVINGYAAAMLGRLRSLPLTFAGALLLGVLQGYIEAYGGNLNFGQGWLGPGPVLVEMKKVLPVVFLFGILVFLPQARLRAGRVSGRALPPVPPLRASMVGVGAFTVLAVAASMVLSDVWLFHASTGLVLGMVMLSLVVLTGFGGQVSLCQFTFVGVGAFVMGNWFSGGSPLGVVLAALAAGVVGAVIALPALRLQDLYLALATFAFALLADRAFFEHPDVFTRGGNLFYERFSLLGIHLESETALFILAAVVFALFGALVHSVRRSPFGRRLAAMSDSPAACATLGMSILTTKVAVFALSAAMAGAAGAFYGVVRTTSGALDFNALQSLFVFLLATFGGITTVTGAFIGGVVFALLPVVQDEVLSSVDLRALFIGGGAIVVSRYPNGFAGLLLAARDRWRRAGGGGPAGEPAAVRSEPADRDRAAELAPT